ncbi:response regulator, partial [Myxococcota bacterium]|nr:response regulator [Myxococcota bacterium]
MQGAIVVADKSKTVRRMVEIALAKQPFTLELCEDGQAALAAINARAPQVAIVDADLPGIDGYALAQRAAGVKVILMVGRSKQYDAARGQGAGVHSHLAKPFVTQKLIEVLFTALGQEIPDAYLFRSTTLNIPLVRKDASSASPAPKPAIGGGASLNLMGPPSSAGLSGLGVKPPALGAGGLGAGALGAKPPLPAMGRRAAV